MSDINNPSRTKIIIDRLVLRGIDPHHAEALAESLKQQLARTLSDPAQRRQLLSASNSPALRLGRIPLASGRAGARDFGAKVARAIGTQVSSLRSSRKGGTQ
jgi:hypothetical protein